MSPLRGMHLLVPRGTDRSREHYSQRGAVERESGVLKHQWGLLPLRVRRIGRVRLHVDLTIHQLERIKCSDYGEHETAVSSKSGASSKTCSARLNHPGVAKPTA